MDITTEINREKNLRIHKIDGLIDIGELKTMLAAYYSSPDYDPNMNAIWDLTNADTSAVTSHDVSSLAELVKQHWGKTASKAALVANKDLNFGLSRMYESLVSDGESHNVMVFKEIADALNWLAE